MNEQCTLYKTADFIGKRWTILILLELYRERMKPKRFNKLKNSLPGITQKVLSDRLKNLEQQGLLAKKTDLTTAPIKCEYSLTKSGKELMEIIKQIKNWALKWNLNNKNCQKTDCLNCE